MIKISDKYEMERDQWQWILTELRPGKNKDGEPILSKRVTYHPTIPLVARTILEREAGKCNSVDGLVELFEKGVERLITAMKKPNPKGEHHEKTSISTNTDRVGSRNSTGG